MILLFFITVENILYDPLEQKPDGLLPPFLCRSVSSMIGTGKGLKYTRRPEWRRRECNRQGSLSTESKCLCPEGCRTAEVSLVEECWCFRCVMCLPGYTKRTIFFGGWGRTGSH